MYKQHAIKRTSRPTALPSFFHSHHVLGECEWVRGSHSRRPRTVVGHIRQQSQFPAQKIHNYCSVRSACCICWCFWVKHFLATLIEPTLSTNEQNMRTSITVDRESSTTFQSRCDRRFLVASMKSLELRWISEMNWFQFCGYHFENICGNLRNLPWIFNFFE